MFETVMSTHVTYQIHGHFFVIGLERLKQNTIGEKYNYINIKRYSANIKIASFYQIIV